MHVKITIYNNLNNTYVYPSTNQHINTSALLSTAIILFRYLPTIVWGPNSKAPGNAAAAASFHAKTSAPIGQNSYFISAFQKISQVRLASHLSLLWLI